MYSVMENNYLTIHANVKGSNYTSSTSNDQTTENSLERYIKLHIIEIIFGSIEFVTMETVMCDRVIGHSQQLQRPFPSQSGMHTK